MVNCINLSNHLYGICLGLSFLLGAIVLTKLLMKQVSKDHIILFLFMSGSFILLGAKEMALWMGDGTNLIDAGLSSIGGVLGFFVSIWIMDSLTHTDHIYFNQSIKVIPLMYSISKLGCFFSGCCCGFAYDGLFHVQYATHSYFPVQLLETIVFMIVFLLFYKRDTTGNCILVCSLSKFMLDYLRISHRGQILSINQLFCLLIVIFYIFFVKKCNKRRLKLELK